MEEKKLAKKRKNNMKLYPIYIATGLDLIFYYGIEMLFLTQVKQIAVADIVLSSSLYAMFGILLQIPISAVIQKLGKRRSLVIANTMNFLYVILIMTCKGFMQLVIAQFISAIAFALKGVSESSILNNSIPATKNKGNIFSNISGKGYSKYSYLAAISTFISGFLFDINPYIPMSISLIFVALAIVCSANFIELDQEKEKAKKVTIKDSIQDLKSGFKFVFKSKRLKSLLIMLGFIWGIICLFSKYQVTLLQEMQVSASYIGIILAALQIIGGLASTKMNTYNEKHGNKTLTILALNCTIGIAIAGLCAILNIPFAVQIIIILITYIIRNASKGVFQVAKSRYMSSFTNDSILPKILAANSMINNLARMLIGFIGTAILKITNIQNSMIISGILFTAIAVLIYLYMKPRVGLKPEEYAKEDIEYSVVK